MGHHIDPKEQSGPVIARIKFGPLPTHQELLDRLRRARDVGATLRDRLSSAANNDPVRLASARARWATDLREFEAKYLHPEPPTLDTSADDQPKHPASPTSRRQRRPDFVAMVKRAQAAGIGIKSVNITDKSMLLTFNEEVPAPADATVIETADELRKLI
jgi:hypothetical protein